MKTYSTSGLGGETGEQDIIRSFESYAVKDRLLFKKDLELDFRIDDVETPHNVINRVSTMSEGIFYRSGRIYRNSGLYFLINFHDSSYKDMVLAALRLLEDRGVGGNISSGFGSFNMYTREVN